MGASQLIYARRFAPITNARLQCVGLGLVWHGSPSTMSLGQRPTSVPSGILIHETVWPQYTRVTDDRRQTTDRRHLMTIAERYIATVG